MKQIASDERRDKLRLQQRCSQLEQALHGMPRPSLSSSNFYPMASLTPTQPQYFPMIQTDIMTEKCSIESVEVPDYLK